MLSFTRVLANKNFVWNKLVQGNCVSHIPLGCNDSLQLCSSSVANEVGPESIPGFGGIVGVDWCVWDTNIKTLSRPDS